VACDGYEALEKSSVREAVLLKRGRRFDLPMNRGHSALDVH